MGTVLTKRSSNIEKENHSTRSEKSLIQFPWRKSEYCEEDIQGETLVALVFGEPEIILQFWRRSNDTIPEQYTFSKTSCFDKRYRHVYMRNLPSREPEIVGLPKRLSHLSERLQKWEKDCDMISWSGIQIPVLTRVYENGNPTGEVTAKRLHYMSFPWGPLREITDILEDIGFAYYTTKIILCYLEFQEEITYLIQEVSKSTSEEESDLLSADWTVTPSDPKRGPFFFSPGEIIHDGGVENPPRHNELSFSTVRKMISHLVRGGYEPGISIGDITVHRAEGFE